MWWDACTRPDCTRPGAKLGAGDFIGRFTNTTNWKPQYIEFPQENVSIVDICCGECFSAVLDQLGRIWAWGSFRDMTGKEHFDGKTKRQQSPSLLESNLAAVSFSAGESHFVVLYENGSVRGWGINSHGQLGRPCHGKELNENCVGIPIVLPAQFRPTSIYACGFSTFVTGKDGNGVFSLLACGGNGYGELGMGQEVTSWQLREVCAMGGKNVVDIKGGLHHTVLLDDVGDVYVAGRGDSGQLGLGLTVQHSNVFIQIPLPSKANGIACSTSGNQTYLSICDGTLYSMGYNCYGQLGLKHEESVVTAPSLVPLKSRKALLIAAGSQFLIVGASDRIE
ncbi:RCC1/BLIP-II protein [Rhizoclosmatium globosum]|uniref:RCC1/BLIP-II protein n=1 Tax=Rhizoclosmatium globosum TaxID=329046 RepID=A0A1Y2CZK5_9FUNG|nr:RCC1/BLIP-II protein [Rhizoclosmatium globosum]|eukprot:ORY52468.1 RCC1/BLIP-II protein [Rhizoclosmatium globosum]